VIAIVAAITLAGAQVEYQKALDRTWEPGHVLDAYAQMLKRAEQEVQVQIAQARLDSALGSQKARDCGVNALAAQRDAAQAHVTQTLNAQAAYSLTLELLAAEVELAQLKLNALLDWENPVLEPSPQEEITRGGAWPCVRTCALAAFCQAARP
jgi:hypothetical protein